MIEFVRAAARNPHEYSCDLGCVAQMISGMFVRTGAAGSPDRPATSAFAVDAVMLCDRGTMDSKAHVPAEVWQQLLQSVGKTEEEMCEGRYDAVLHFVTAADGAEEAYSLSGNAARTETAEEARESDAALVEVWSRHPDVAILDNAAEGGLEAKIQRAVQTALRVAGVA